MSEEKPAQDNVAEPNMTRPSLSGWILHKNDTETYENAKLTAAAESEGIHLRIVRPNDVDLLVTRSGRRSVRVAGEETRLPDFILPRTGSGTTYFALAVMRHFERLGVRMFNAAEAIEAVKDKLFSQQILAASDLPVPKTMLVKHPTDAEFVEQSLGFPIVIKTLAGSHGEGVFLAEDRLRFIDLMQLIATTAPTVNIILQEFISQTHGRDIRVIVVGGRAVGAMQRVSVDGSFKTNISRGGKAEPFTMTANAEWLAMEATRVLGLDIAGVDLLFDGDDEYRICEVNSAPQFEGLEGLGQADIAAQIMHYIRIRLGR
jgi:gamma-F420-2:alpha-L-glutamate ligase